MNGSNPQQPVNVNAISPDPAEAAALDDRLREGVRTLLEMRGNEPQTTTGVHHDNLVALARIGTLLTDQPEGYAAQVRKLAEPLVHGRTNDIGVLARAYLALGQSYLAGTGADSIARARVHLEQAWAFCATLPSEDYDITLVTIVRTQLALALHRQGARADAHETLLKAAELIRDHVFASEIEKKNVQAIFDEIAGQLGPR